MYIIGGFVSLVAFEETEFFANFMEEVTGEKYEGGKMGTHLGQSYFGQFTKYILKTETSQIDRMTPNEFDLNEAINAKSKFYKMSLENGDIRYVCFDYDKADLIPPPPVWKAHSAFEEESNRI